MKKTFLPLLLALGAPALAYATVYPLVMFMRIILPQLLAVLLWAGS